MIISRSLPLLRGELLSRCWRSLRLQALSEVLGSRGAIESTPSFAAPRCIRLDVDGFCANLPPNRG